MESEIKVWIIQGDRVASAPLKIDIDRNLPNAESIASAEFSRFALQANGSPDLIISLCEQFTDSSINAAKTYLSKHKDTPWIVLGNCTSKEEIGKCFQSGATDYLSLPIHWPELLIKLERAISRKWQTKKLRLHEVQLAELTLKELRIYNALKKAENCRLSRADIIRAVWGNQQLSSKSFDVHLFHLRKKLWKLGLQIKYVPTNHYQLIEATK